MLHVPQFVPTQQSAFPPHCFPMLGPLTHVSFGQSGDVVPLTDVEPANAVVGSMTIPCGGGVFVAVGVGVVVGVGVFADVGVTVGVLVGVSDGVGVCVGVGV